MDHFTLIRFFAFHYLLPFIVLALRAIHVVYLHTTGSNNLLGLKFTVDKFKFSPYYLKKDGLGVFFILLFFFFFSIYHPYII